MRKLRASFLAGLVVASSALLVWPALLSPGTACASASGAGHAALVVGTGSQTFRFCVGLDSASVSGIHLIELASTQDDLQYRLGFGGLAVCQLAGVGPTGGDCFAKYPDYWGLWLGDGAGGWTWSSSGAGSVQIHDGDIEGWTWGTGDSGATHPAPPVTTVAEVCLDASPSKAPSVKPPPAHAPPSSHGLLAPPSRDANPISGSADAPTRGSREPGSPGSEAEGPSTSGSVQVAAAAGGGSSAAGGPPAGALLALAGVVALGGVGWLRVHAGSRKRTL